MKWEDVKNKSLEILGKIRVWVVANPKKTIMLLALAVAFLAGAVIF